MTYIHQKVSKCKWSIRLIFHVVVKHETRTVISEDYLIHTTTYRLDPHIVEVSIIPLAWLLNPAQLSLRVRQFNSGVGFQLM